MQDDQQSRLYDRYLYLKMQMLLLGRYSKYVGKEQSEKRRICFDNAEIRIYSPDGKVFDEKHNWINKLEWEMQEVTQASKLVLFPTCLRKNQKAE